MSTRPRGTLTVVPGERHDGVQAEEDAAEQQPGREHEQEADAEVHHGHGPLGEDERATPDGAKQDDAQRTQLRLAGDHVAGHHSCGHGQQEADEEEQRGQRDEHAVAGDPLDERGTATATLGVVAREVEGERDQERDGEGAAPDEIAAALEQQLDPLAAEGAPGVAAHAPGGAAVGVSRWRDGPRRRGARRSRAGGGKSDRRAPRALSGAPDRLAGRGPVRWAAGFGDRPGTVGVGRAGRRAAAPAGAHRRPPGSRRARPARRLPRDGSPAS